MIIVDFLQIAFGAFVHNKDCDDDDFELARHLILNSLRNYNKKFRNEYGTMILANEGGKNWRRREFPHYKAKRSIKRDKDERDWSVIFNTFERVINDIREHAPFRILTVPGAEGDDIIATLVKSTQEFGRNEPVMILSSDHDFVQLHRYSNVRQYSPLTKKYITEKDIGRYINKHVVKGDTGDGVPNIKSQDDIFLVEGLRQSSISAKFLEEVYTNKDNLSKVLSTQEIERYNRNMKLVNLDYIPSDIKEAIYEEYNEDFDVAMRKSKFMNYLVKNRMALLAAEIGDFY